MEKKGAILVVSGPSGCGKSTLLKNVYKEIGDYYFSISTTTRTIRANEKHGVDYFYVSKEEFKRNIKNNNFLEWASVHENYYGTLLKPIKKAIKEGKLVIFDIDVQGHEMLRKKLNGIITSVFITTPSLEILKQRLKLRNTDSLNMIEKRLENAKEEIKFFQKYDYLIINDCLQRASKDLLSIANITRIKSRVFEKKDILENWLQQ